jgi:putative copper resistance protein D
MLELLLPAPFHAFFGVIVMMSNTVLLTSYANPPASWGIDPLYDQGAAGGIAWSFGEFPTVLVLAVVFFSWTRSEERANRAADRVHDRAVARGESGEDPELTAYNERLRRLAAQRP